MAWSDDEDEDNVSDADQIEEDKWQSVNSNAHTAKPLDDPIEEGDEAPDACLAKLKEVKDEVSLHGFIFQSIVLTPDSSFVEPTQVFLMFATSFSGSLQ